MHEHRTPLQVIIDLMNIDETTVPKAIFINVQAQKAREERVIKSAYLNGFVDGIICTDEEEDLVMEDTTTPETKADQYFEDLFTERY